MLRKILVIGFIAAMVVFGLNGCGKEPVESPSETEEVKAAAEDKAPAKEQIKTAAQYQAQAKEQITEDNMADELDKIEKELEQDISQEQ